MRALPSAGIFFRRSFFPFNALSMPSFNNSVSTFYFQQISMYEKQENLIFKYDLTSKGFRYNVDLALWDRRQESLQGAFLTTEPNPLDLSFMNNRNSTTVKNPNFLYVCNMNSCSATVQRFILQSLFVAMRYADKSFFIEIICRKKTLAQV